MCISLRQRVAAWLLFFISAFAASAARAESELGNVFTTRLVIPFSESLDSDLESQWNAQVEWTWIELDELAPAGSRGAALSTLVATSYRYGRWQTDLSLHALQPLGDSIPPLGEAVGLEASMGIDLGPLGLLRTTLVGENVVGESAAMTILVRWNGVFRW